MHKRFILLLAVFLSTQVPTAAQTRAQQIVPAQERVASIMTTVQTVLAPSLAASFLLSDAHFSYPFVRAYEPDQSLRNLSPMHEVKTLFLTQSSLPLMQVWGGRLRLDGFTSTLHMQNVQLGPSAAGRLQDFRPQRQVYTSGLPSIRLYGLSLSFHFGRDGSKSKLLFLASSATLQLRQLFNLPH